MLRISRRSVVVNDASMVAVITLRDHTDLEHLSDIGAAERTLRYGQVGRPETRYGLRGQG